MKILILGHTGFLGKNVHKYLKSSESNQLSCISSADLDLTSQEEFFFHIHNQFLSKKNNSSHTLNYMTNNLH